MNICTYVTELRLNRWIHVLQNNWLKIYFIWDHMFLIGNKCFLYPAIKTTNILLARPTSITVVTQGIPNYNHLLDTSTSTSLTVATYILIMSSCTIIYFTVHYYWTLELMASHKCNTFQLQTHFVGKSKVAHDGKLYL